MTESIVNPTLKMMRKIEHEDILRLRYPHDILGWMPQTKIKDVEDKLGI